MYRFMKQYDSKDTFTGVFVYGTIEAHSPW